STSNVIREEVECQAHLMGERGVLRLLGGNLGTNFVCAPHERGHIGRRHLRGLGQEMTLEVARRQQRARLVLLGRMLAGRGRGHGTSTSATPAIASTARRSCRGNLRAERAMFG